MRVRLRDDLHALRRPGALAAVVAALGGLLAVWFPRTTAWRLVATVDAVGTADERTVAHLRAAEVTDVAWAAPVIGVVVVVVALLVAIDRPPVAAERLLLLGAVGMLALTIAVIVARPAPAAFAAHGRAADLVGAQEALPAGIEIELRVGPAPAPVALGVAALGVAVCGLLATRRA